MNHDKPRREEEEQSSFFPWLLIVALLLPLIVMLLIPAGLYVAFGLWVAMLIIAVAFWLFLKGQAATVAALEEPEVRMLYPEEQTEVVRDIMRVRLATEEAGVQIYRGHLLEDPARAYEKLKTAVADRFIPLLQQDERLGASILLMPRALEDAADRPIRMWKHWLLFALTLGTTTWVGAAYQGVNVLESPLAFTAGLPYSLALITILGVHEMGHYFAAKRHGMKVTPPYFIPVPFALGTFGAFIQMRSPPEHRKALFDVAVAGPLAGLVIAIPALLAGLRTSEAVAAPDGFIGSFFTSSFLLTLLAKFSLGDIVQDNTLLRLSPMAFAGWLGLLITALNLLPIGQLDGGHTARAMFGHRTGTLISTIAMWTLLLLAIFVWPALMIWALIVFIIARRGTPPLNDLTPVSPGRRLLGFVTFGILAMILLPFPHGLWQTLQNALFAN